MYFIARKDCFLKLSTSLQQLLNRSLNGREFVKPPAWLKKMLNTSRRRTAEMRFYVKDFSSDLRNLALRCTYALEKNSRIYHLKELKIQRLDFF